MKDYNVFKNIQRHISLSDDEVDHLISVIEVKEVSRKELILKQGQLCRNLFFIESGSLRAFNLSQAGKESTIMFAVEDWWITDMNRFINQKPAIVSIEALEDSRVIKLDYQSYSGLFEKIPQFERFFRILFQNAYIREQQRSFHNISLTTEERYRYFLEKYPVMVEKVTQKQIASYLGVTPEFLSAIKKK